MPHKFTFVFIQYFIGEICQKSLANSGGLEKYTRGEGVIAIQGQVSVEEGYKPSSHYDSERLKGGISEP